MPATTETAVLSETPHVGITAAAVEPKLAAALAELAEPLLEGALVSDPGGGRRSDGRTCSSCWLSHDSSPTVRTAVDAIAAVAGIDAALGERLHLIRYTTGGEYRPHFDAYRLDTETGQRCTRRRGQRTHTAILYLNTVAAGGATVFPKLGIEVPAIAGSVLAFDNCIGGGTDRDERSLHGGAPVLAGEKWIATLWFRERPRQ